MLAILLLTLAAPPNVVIILSDDQGWGDLSGHGNTNLKTPNIDALARAGASFDRFYVQPVCSPTRAEMLTGRWHPRGGVHGVSTGAERLNLDEKTIADAFKAGGYVTGCFGKWHNGTQYPYHPLGRGFTDYYGFTSGHWGEYFDPPLDDNGKQVRGKGYITDDLTSRAITFLTKNKAAGQPSFCYLALCTPHSPMQVPETYWKRLAGAKLALRGDPREDLDHTRAALAMCENIDDNVGRLLAALKEHKLERDTIVLYFSDNGPNGQRWNGGMKGRKGSTDEGGVRSPLRIVWPGTIAPNTVIRPIAAAIDLYPTLAELCGIKVVGDKPLDGISLAPWLRGKDVDMPMRVLFQHWAGRTSARDQRYRLDAQGKLYDLQSDPGQKVDVTAKHPDVAKRLGDAVVRWRKDVLGAVSKEDHRPFPVGHPALPRAMLPARDGVGHAGVKRSAPAPNCSFFTSWTEGGHATWNIEVGTPGRYEIIIHHTAPKSAVGSILEIKFADMTLSGRIAEPHDPPLRGKEHDRVPRGAESYVKEFRPLSLGEVDWKAGRGLLTLTATKVVGTTAGDIRAVEVVLKK